MTDEQYADVMTFALYDGLGQRIPIRDEILCSLSPARRKDIDAACARHRERMAALNDQENRP